MIYVSDGTLRGSDLDLNGRWVDDAGVSGLESSGSRTTVGTNCYPPGMKLRCRCVWNDVLCPNDATQEDGLCDWCGRRRPEDLVGNPKAMFHAVTGEFLGLGGGGEAHLDTSRTPNVCWQPTA